ncbi:MAG TPA: hypothetical protein VJ826_05315, partial [Candidatus Polarisedimenticolaceae bacterium]|nr:hypothetical protein [Candidatus Polarisedimenticolaceae bacterium]
MLHTMHDLFGFEHALILLMDEAHAWLRVVASRGYDDTAVGQRVELGVGVIGTVARRKKMMRLGNLSQTRAYVDAIKREVREAGEERTLGPVPTLPGLPDAESQVAIPLLI